MTLHDLNTILAEVSYPGARWKVGLDAGTPWLQVQFYRADNDDPRADRSWQGGRKWRLSHHMTKSEIVQTAFMAIMAFEEHEIREGFKFRNQRIFGPHFNVDDLAILAASKKEDARPQMQEAA